MVLTPFCCPSSTPTPSAPHYAHLGAMRPSFLPELFQNAGVGAKVSRGAETCRSSVWLLFLHNQDRRLLQSIRHGGNVGSLFEGWASKHHISAHVVTKLSDWPDYADRKRTSAEKTFYKFAMLTILNGL